MKNSDNTQRSVNPSRNIAWVDGFVVAHINAGYMQSVPNGWHHERDSAIKHCNALADANPDDKYGVWSCKAWCN